MRVRTCYRSAFVFSVIYVYADVRHVRAVVPDSPAKLILTSVRDRLLAELKVQEAAHEAFLKSAPAGFQAATDTNSHVDRMREIEKWRMVLWQAKLQTKLRVGELRTLKYSRPDFRIEPRELTRLPNDTFDLLLRKYSVHEIPEWPTDIDVWISARQSWLRFQTRLCDKLEKVLYDAFDHEMKAARLIANHDLEEAGMLQRISCLKAAIEAVDFALSLIALGRERG